MNHKLATLIGISAIILWATNVGLMKKVSLIFGADLGIALIYTMSAITLLICLGIPVTNKKSLKKLSILTFLFLIYEICMSFAIGLSHGERQAIEISMVHYLWPSFTILAFVIVKEVKSNLGIWSGLLISIFGIFYMQIGGGTENLELFFDNFNKNKTAYILSFLAAIIWSIYCVFSRKYGSFGKNTIVFYFIIVAIFLWVKFIFFHDAINLNNYFIYDFIYVFFCGAAIGLGYAAWNIGITLGNFKLVVFASYFTPIISAILAMLILNASLGASFWIGALSITLGSLICWFSTRN